ncbi:MAG: hypothetical protein OEV31_08510, partial [Gammaproteobacteria bacterium]|nr:hypothetical protein [Gammaproteobacteria bacterium]
AAIVHIANTIATLAEINSTNMDESSAISALAWSTTGLKPDVIEPVIREAQNQFRETRQLFMGDAA